MTPRRFRKTREKLGWSQAKLGEALGVSVVTISRWENGHQQIPLMAHKFVRVLMQVHGFAENRERLQGASSEATAEIEDLVVALKRSLGAKTKSESDQAGAAPRRGRRRKARRAT